MATKPLTAADFPAVAAWVGPETAKALASDLSALGLGAARVHDTQALIDAAIEAERECCAQVAESNFIPGHTVAGPAFAARTAELIRMRGAAGGGVGK